MRKFLLVISVLFIFSGCAQKQTENEKINTDSSSKIYSVDEFVEGGFKQGNKLQISIKSVTCYNNSCGFEGGGKWGIGTNVDDSKNFYPYAGKGVDMIIQADPDCSANETQCNKIKNVSILKGA